MKKIVNDDLGIMYFEVVDDKFKLYDSDEEYIGYIETKSGFRSEEDLFYLPLKLTLINHVSELVDLGFCWNMLFNVGSKENVIEQLINYGIEENYINDRDELGEVNVNRIGTNYFIVDFNE